MVTIDHMLKDVFVEIERPEHTLREMLVEVFFYLIDGGRRFPGITTAHLYSVVVEKDYRSPGAEDIRRARPPGI